jgi:hypothetical protein
LGLSDSSAPGYSCSAELNSAWGQNPFDYIKKFFILSKLFYKIKLDLKNPLFSKPSIYRHVSLSHL